MKISIEIELECDATPDCREDVLHAISEKTGEFINQGIVLALPDTRAIATPISMCVRGGEPCGV